ncbi:MAG: hypothetical protein WA131_03550 [Desulfitobacteriaceae bacterium]
MTKKIFFLLLMLSVVALLLTGCSFAIPWNKMPSLPWAKKATSTNTQSTSSSGNAAGASGTDVTNNSLSTTFSLNLPDQSSDKTLKIKGIIGKAQKLFVNDQEGSVDANGNFTSTVDLVPGSNQLTVKVFSKDGSSVYSTGKNVTYTPHIPKLIITSPLKSSYASETSTITISGTTDSNCKVTANGANSLPDVNGNFIITVPLKSGENIIKLDSTNPSGLVNSFQQVLNFTKVDKNQKPKLVVSLPSDTTAKPTGYVSSKDIPISGFTDPNNIIEVYNNYYQNDKKVQSLIFKGTINNGTFAIPVTLSEGTNTLLIRATNEFDQSTDQTKTVNYKK